MKTKKRMLPLLLALMMALSIMAVPALAEEDTPIMRRPVGPCPVCRTQQAYVITPGQRRYVKITCKNSSTEHYHDQRGAIYAYDCGHSAFVVQEDICSIQ